MELSDDEIDFLRDLQKRLLTDDNLHTSDPIFQVRERYKQYVPDDCGSDVDFIENVSGDHHTFNTITEVYSFLEGYGDIKPCDYDECYDIVSYEWMYRVINTHFTRLGAEMFIRRKQHDYGELSIYVSSLGFCVEMRRLRDILLKLNFK